MAFVIPTIFTAIDKVSSTVAGIQRNVQGFAARAEGAFAKATAPLANASKQIMAYGESALLIGGAAFSYKAISDYNTELANLQAVTGATGSTFDLFRQKITEVALATKKSTVEVAQAFTNVDNNMPVLHKNAAALAEVTKQSIILAKASRMELGPSAEALTMAMNQYGLGADKARMAVDAMAAGQVAGSSKINETAEAIQKFGTVAANVAHITFSESVALVELASKFEKGGEAGTRLRNILLDMTNIKYGPAAAQIAALGVNLNKVSNTSLPFIDRFKELSKIRNSPLAMEKLFDKRNVAMAAGLMSVIDKYDNVLSLTNETGFAERMAAINTNTLAGAVDQLRARWVTYITTNDKVNTGTNFLKNTIQLLTDHLDGLMSIVGRVIEAFIVYKGLVYGLRAATLLLSAATRVLQFWQGVATVVNGRYAASCFATSSGIRGMAAASFFLEASTGQLIAMFTIATGVIAAMGWAFSRSSGGVDELNSSILETEKGFAKIKRPINQATLALQEYIAAVDNYNEKRLVRAQMERSNPIGIAINDMMNHMFTHPFKPITPDTLEVPKLNLSPSDTLNLQKEYIPNYDSAMPNIRQQLNSNNGNVTVTIKNESGKKLNVQSTGGVAVNMDSTFSFTNRRTI